MSKDWKRGLQRIAKGIYADQKGAMHIDEEELLRAHGYADNEHNRRMIREAAAKIAGEIGVKYHEANVYVCAHCGASVKNPEEHSC